MGKTRYKSLVEYEKKLNYDKKSTFINFKKRVDIQKNKLVKLLIKLKKQKKKFTVMEQARRVIPYYNITK